MRSELVDVTLVVDRSGSMSDCRQEAENGVNHFIQQQRDQPGQCLLSLVQFDTEYEFVHRGVPMDKVGPYSLVPRGMTALLDAVGRAINETGERLASLAEQDRPGLVVFVIVTDGHENSSHEFRKAQIREMITHQTDRYGWQFTYLGANQDAFAEARGLGIPASAAANYATARSFATFRAAGANVTRMRTSAIRGQAVNCGYTAEEREEMRGGSEADPAPRTTTATTTTATTTTASGSTDVGSQSS